VAQRDPAIELVAFEPRWLDELVPMWRSSIEPSWQLEAVKLQWVARAQADPGS
jgi:hypothetical protein